jgi:membrane protease subunit (stomatin/prohibitin family)
MGIWDKVKGQLRSVIQWEDPAPDALFERWTDNGDEIKNTSKLIVGPGQGCIFIYEGRVEAIHLEEGISDIDTENIPFWTTLSKFMQAFESEHKVGIYFFRRTKILDQKWGTPSVIKYDDPKYKFPVGLRAYGNYTFRIVEPGAFFVNVIGGSAVFTAEDFRQVMNSRIVQNLTDFMAESSYSYAEIDANREELAQGLNSKIGPEFEKLGFGITDFRIEGTSFDDDTVRRIGRIADLSAESQAAQAAGLDYSQMQQLEAMREAARNEGGGAGMGMGLGAGLQFGQMMAGSMAGGDKQEGVKEDPVAKLKQLKAMVDQGLISEEEYNAKKKEILDAM